MAGSFGIQDRRLPLHVRRMTGIPWRRLRELSVETEERGILCQLKSLEISPLYASALHGQYCQPRLSADDALRVIFAYDQPNVRRSARAALRLRASRFGDRDAS